MNEQTMARDNLWKKAFRKFLRDRIGMLSLLVVTIYGVVALGVVLGLWAQDWDELLTEERVGPSMQYWFGTNINGQDVYQRAIYSTKTAFQVGMVVALVATALGALADPH